MPFCPRCGTEYYEEFTHCSECGTELVEHLPKGKSPESIRRNYENEFRKQRDSRGRWNWASISLNIKVGVFFICVLIWGALAWMTAWYLGANLCSNFWVALVIFFLISALIGYFVTQILDRNLLQKGLFFSLILVVTLVIFLLVVYFRVPIPPPI